MLTPKENFTRFFRGEDYEWTPTSEDLLVFRPTFIPDHVCRGSVAQQEPYSGPYGGIDLFGSEWEFQPTNGGSMEVGHQFDDIEDWEDCVKFPDLDSLDWEGCAKANAEYLSTDKLIHTTIYTGFFERLISFVGFEGAAMALIDEEQQEEVVKLFDRLADTYIELIRRFKKYFNIGMVEIHDDWGTQKDLMFSQDIHHELFVPPIRRITDAAHAMGVFIEQHSCGKIEKLVPDMIESGVDTWRGQDIVDRKTLAREYGDRFHFGTVLRVDEPMTDEQAMAKLNQFREDFHGRDIWMAIYGPYATPALKRMLYEDIRKNGKF